MSQCAPLCLKLPENSHRPKSAHVVRLSFALGLLDRDALGEISRLIHIAAAPYCYVIGEQLQRNHFEQGQQQFSGHWNRNDVIRHLGDLFIAFASHRNHNSASRLHFLNIR